ncbi:hypothetical protein ACIP5Y_23870 [Nocardia sp. NPDC088792]|uniref:hypothetical protein n=1 Tax=Nocardia sp. NPDC088792 TaxID=3364332 RepID=UPI0038175D78
MTTGHEGPLTRNTLRYIRRLVEEAAFDAREPATTRAEQRGGRTRAGKADSATTTPLNTSGHHKM